MTLKKSKTARVAAGLVGFAMAVSAFVPAVASADMASDLQAQINSLLATIASLQAQLSGTTGGSTGYTFNTNLTVGSTGADVKNLQKVLNMSADTKVANSGNGSPGMETSYFGPATKAAVMKFQTKYGITPVAGYVGAITRAKLNSMNTVGTTPVTPGTPTGGSLSVSAGSQPANSLAPTNAARVPFTTVVLTAGSSDVTVNSLTVERTGLAQDAVFSGVVLLKSDGTQIGIAKTLNSNHQAMVGEPWVIKAGTSQTVTVAGNIGTVSSTYAGQVASLSVVAVNTSASVSGSLPITGAMHTANGTLTLGTAPMTSSSYDPGSSQTKEIGTTGYKFAGVRLTAGSAEQVRLWSVRWNQSGSASSNDLANVKVYVDGTAYDTTVSADGKYYSALFSGGILVDKGNSKDIYIQGDIVGTGSAGRTVKFDIYKATDIYVSGVTYGYGITATQSQSGTASDSTSEFTAGTPFFDGSKVTVSAGSVTSIQKATSVAAQNIAVNVPNQVLGGFSTDIKGEALSAQSTVFYFNYSAGVLASSYLLTNVSIVDQNGAVVAGPVDAVNVGGIAQKVTFTDTLTLPLGQQTFTLKGKIPTGVANGTTIVASTTPTSDWTNVTGQTTGNSITSLGSVFSMNTMTVKTAALAVTQSATPAAQTIVAGGQGVTFANFQFDATQSGEDVRFSSLALTTSAYTGLTSCQLYDGSTALNTGSNVVNPSSVTPTFTLDQQLIVSKGTVKTLTLKCNVSSSATGGFTWNITSAQIGAISTTGVTSSSTVTPTGATTSGTAQTVGSSTLVVSLSPSSPSYKLVAAGSSNNVIGVLRFRAANESMTLSKVSLKLTNTASSSASDLVQVSIWDGATQVGTATFTGTSNYATSSALSVVLPKDADKDLEIRAEFAQIGTGLTGVQGDLVAIDFNGSDSTGTQATGANSGSTISATGSSAVSGARLFSSVPTFALDTLSGNGVTDGKLMRFKVTAGSNVGNHGVGINQFKFTMSTTSATVSAVNLYGYTESTYSSGISGFTSGQLATSNVAPGVLGAVTITPSAVVNIPAGSTYYFELRGTVTGSGTAYSVNTILSGDTSYPALAANMGSSASVVSASANLVWSPNATTTSNASHIDWTNGYGVSGLPSSGLSNNRAQ
ncbi:MAG: hypothetical protein CEO12_322 [Parcubacteria group bacterium Gr01-1014_46]|nr:MAG: hypothetical protein CEO12_322 [Parcubacteria group bacterium Gr01-1014_46]